MTDYRILIWEMNLETNIACVMYDFFHMRLNGKQFACDKMIQIFLETYIDKTEWETVLQKVSLERLRGLKDEESFESKVYLDNGECNKVRVLLIPSVNEQGVTDFVYLIVDIESIDGMSEIVHNRKKGIRGPLRRIARMHRAHLFVILVTCAFFVIAYFCIGGIRQALFEEQSHNLMLLMKKMGQNIDAVMENKWDDVHYVSNQLCSDEFESLDEFLWELEDISSYLEMGNNTMMAISEDGKCYHFSGQNFDWKYPELLSSSTEEAVITSFPSLELNMEQILFTTRLPHNIQAGPVTFTHIVLSSDMQVLDEFLQVRDYGAESANYIIHNDRQYVYRVGTDETEKNTIFEIEKYKFRYHTSYDKLIEDLANGRSGCVYVTYQGVPYYVTYNKLRNNDWYAVLMVPAKYVGNSTYAFMQDIMIAIGLISLGVLSCILLLVYVDNRKERRETTHVNEALRKVSQVTSRAVESQKNANKAKTRFLSSMTHDIRTPMNVIVGMTELATRRIQNTEYVKECLEKISLASKHLLTLINDVLDISKVESGSMSLNINVFSIMDLMANLENIMIPEAERKIQQLDIRMQGITSEYLLGDELRINQIFINLVTNAIKYTPEGGKIKVSLWEEEVFGEENRIKLVYVIEDNGIGMSEEFQKNMYDIFSRETDSRVNKIQGTGLGLAIVKQMVDLMEGTIECESREGRGTKISVRLKLGKAEKTECLEKMDNSENNECLAGMRVLVAEDNELNWEILSTMFEMYDICAERVENGEQCLKRMKEVEDGAYEVILMDIQMPIMNGKDATRELRKSNSTWVRNIPIVAMTADAFAEDVQECMAVGMNGHIAKPIDMKKMFGELRKYHK